MSGSGVGPEKAAEKPSLLARFRGAAATFRQLPGTFRLLWRASPGGTVAISALTGVNALLPAAIAWLGKLIVDSVVRASRSGNAADRREVFLYVGIELALMVITTTSGRLMGLLREVVGARLALVLGVKILEKATDLELRHFEDADVYDKMQNARRESGSRPLSLTLEALSMVQNGITLATYAVLIVRLSPWSVA